MPKRLLLLSDINSIHTRKWALSLAKEGFSIKIFSLTTATDSWYEDEPNITYYSFRGYDKNYALQKTMSKLGYLTALRPVKRLIADFRPDIIHAHYATSYGMLGALCKGKCRYAISVWGEDVTEFPHEGLFQRQLLKFNFRKADLILATSKFLAEVTKKYTAKPIPIIPFGVDTNLFKPGNKKIDQPFTIGIVKTLEYGYAIDLVISAFARIVEKNPSIELKLKICGIGSQLMNLKALAKELNIDKSVEFLGQIDNNQIPEILQTFDIFCCFSRHEESFGVAVVEAMACSLPVVVTKVGGLPEVVEHNVSGIVIESDQLEAAENALQKLIDDKNKREQLGKTARDRATSIYDWDTSMKLLLEQYQSLY